MQMTTSNLSHASYERNVTAADIIRALGGDPRSGRCRCPAHEDRNPSLSVTERNNRILVKCHRGCTQEEVVSKLD
jgi:hypothetical protein